ncbi:MAG: endonuclease/exonuclease/phosphatase family protein [Clostridia bacterium]|nr:endonuclease/exonuclease/phosphatase family protein [Clostridia bacterium]
MELKVISFNIRCCDDKDGHSIAERAPRLASLTLPLDADVIGFQEYRPKWEELIAEYYSDKYEIFNKYRSTEHPESAPILWKRDKFDLIDKGYFWLSDTPEVESKGWDEKYDCHRICEYVILAPKDGGKPFTFMNTHFGFGDSCQTKSARLIYEYGKRISGNPTFVTGDFNMCPDSAGYAEMTKYFTDVNTVTAKDTRQTFHGYAPERHPNEHIDYCFIGEGIKPLSRERIDGTVDGKYPSDHYGLMIKLEI